MNAYEDALVLSLCGVGRKVLEYHPADARQAPEAHWLELGAHARGCKACALAKLTLANWWCTAASEAKAQLVPAASAAASWARSSRRRSPSPEVVKAPKYL